MTTHCPGHEKFKILESYSCTCPQCGTQQEVFSDELEKRRKCRQCGGEFNPEVCTMEAGVPQQPVGER